MSKQNQELDLPTVLSFKGSLTPTIAKFYGVYSDNKEELYKLTQKELKSVAKPVIPERVTIVTNFSNSGSLEQTEKGIERSNIQDVERAILPENTNTLYTNFGLTVTNKWREPIMSKSKEFSFLVKEFTDLFLEKVGVDSLVNLYVDNLYSGKWLFNNYDNASPENIKIRVSDFNFNILDKEDVIELFKKGLISDNNSAQFNIEAFITTFENTKVYPSQLFLSDIQKKESGLGVQLMTFGNNKQVCLSAEKIGLAIRTIDNWYEDGTNYKISINAFGTDRKFNFSFRQANENHLYTYLRQLNKLVTNLKNETFNLNEMNFVIACLILGGLYGSPKKEK